jgi:hypothetical protein
MRFEFLVYSFEKTSIVAPLTPALSPRRGERENSMGSFLYSLSPDGKEGQGEGEIKRC